MPYHHQTPAVDNTTRRRIDRKTLQASWPTKMSGSHTPVGTARAPAAGKCLEDKNPPPPHKPSSQPAAKQNVLLMERANHSRVTGDKKKTGVIRKYSLNMSRQAFREKADAMGWKKVYAPSFFNPPGERPLILRVNHPQYR